MGSYDAGRKDVMPAGSGPYERVVKQATYSIQSSASDSKINLSRPMAKPTICIGENKDADQLRGNLEADQRLCFRYSDSTIPLLLKSEISSF